MEIVFVKYLNLLGIGLIICGRKFKIRIVKFYNDLFLYVKDVRR